MSASEFWASTAVGVVSGVVATLLSAAIIWLLGKIRRSSPADSSAGGPIATSGDGGISIGQVSGGSVDARVKNKTKKVDRSTTNKTQIIQQGAAKSSDSDSDGWIWPVSLGLALFIAALFVRWNEYAFLASSIAFGMAIGCFLGTVAWPPARASWNKGSTLVAVQAAITVLAFVSIWLGIFNVKRDDWSMNTMRAAAQESGAGLKFGESISAIIGALGSQGMLLAVWLMIAAIVSVALSAFLTWSVVDWWLFLVAGAGKFKKRRAKRYKRFAAPTNGDGARYVAAPLILATLGTLCAWAVLLPA